MIHGKVECAAPRSFVEHSKGKLGWVASRCVMHLIGWMLLGFVIAGPSLPNLHSQEPRPAMSGDTKQGTVSRLGENSTLPSYSEIVLPDIHILVGHDSTAVLKQRLEEAERDLQELQRKRHHLLKTIEEIEKRLQSRQNPVGPRSSEFVVRPSV